MRINIEITDDTLPSDLSRLARAIMVMAGTDEQQTVTTHTHSAPVVHVAPSKDDDSKTAQAETARADEPLTGTVTTAADDLPAPMPCRNCGFYDCICEPEDAEDAPALDTAAIFGGGIDGSGKPSDDLDTAAIFGGSSSSAPAPSSAAVVPSQTAPTQPPAGASGPQENANPTNAAPAGSPVNAAPTAATSGNPAGVELDSAGLPWDARIHARTKAKIADGTWRQKRGVAPEVIASVTAELRAAMGASAPQAGVGITPPPVNNAAGTPPVNVVGAFPALMNALVPFLQTDEEPQRPLSQSGLRQWAAHLGLVNANNQGEVTMLMHRPELIPAYRELINNHLAQWNLRLQD